MRWQQQQRRIRRAGWNKTNGYCWYCGIQTTPFGSFCRRHVVARPAGGGDTLDNLVPACQHCNEVKNAHDLEHLRIRLTPPDALAPFVFYYERQEARP
jgi:5-methylcytosine-specific restriction endonuclease McrA